jgi:hypothetical protein
MRGTGRRADREAHGGTGTGRRSAARGVGGARRGWGRGWRGDTEARGGGTRRRGAGRRAYRRAEDVLRMLLQVGAFNVENAPRCILVPSYMVIY